MDQGRPLRVMQLGPTMWRGGVASSIRSMCVELVRRGHDVTLVADGGDAAQGIESTGVQYEEVVWSHRPGQLVATVRRVRAAISQFRPDIVHVHGRSQALAAHLARRAADWFTLHSTALTDQVGVLDRGVARRHLSPLGRRCFALNDEAATYLRRQLNVPEDRIRVVPNGVDCTRFRPPSRAERATARATFGLDERSLLVVCVGRLEQEKQPLAVVELAKAAADAGIADAKFVFVGDGRLATTIDERIAGLGVPHAIDSAATRP
jgi:glycosyltransferase involved in cell wall biosynthesis